MKKLFISQPMTGKTDEEIRREREKAIQAAREMLDDDVEVLDSYFPDFNGSPLEYLGRVISMLADADIMYFAPGWEYSRGCRIEHECAIVYDIDTIYHQ